MAQSLPAWICFTVFYWFDIIYYFLLVFLYFTGFYCLRQAWNSCYLCKHPVAYFIQQFCKIIWGRADQDEIDAEMVEQTEKEYLRQLDEGFFRVRYERCTDNEKNFIRAMVECGTLPCTIANVAKNLGSRVQSVSPVRAQLINKGIIYAVRHSELDFTVPAFDQFLKRELGLAE